MVYSHPRRQWLEEFLPSAQLILTNSTTELLRHLEEDITMGAIALSEKRSRQLESL